MNDIEKILNEAKERIQNRAFQIQLFGKNIEMIALSSVMEVLESYKDAGYDYRNMEQPEDCVHGYGVCCYPIEDCPNCPMRPENFGMDGYGSSKATIR